MNRPDQTDVSDELARLKHIESLVFSSRHQEALIAIEKLGALSENSAPKALRLKSYAQLGTGDTEGSYASLQDLIDAHEHQIDDIFAAGERALELRRYAQAEAHMTSAIEKARNAHDDYYTQTCLIERAYARICLGKFSLAEADLDELEDETEVEWLNGTGLLTKQTLRSQLAAKRR